MTDPIEPAGVDASGLRERLPNKPEAPQKAESAETAQQAVRALNEQEQADGKEEKDRKTYGRTLDGKGEYFQCSPILGVERASFLRSDTLGRPRKTIDPEPSSLAILLPIELFNTSNADTPYA